MPARLWEFVGAAALHGFRSADYWGLCVPDREGDEEREAQSRPAREDYARP